AFDCGVPVRQPRKLRSPSRRLASSNPPWKSRCRHREFDMRSRQEFFKTRCVGCRELAAGSDYRVKAQIAGANMMNLKEPKNMKYILMMTGTKAGVDTYRAWSQSEIQAHFVFLNRLNNELSESGELVANEPLAPPEQAKVVRAGKDSAPIT